MSARLNFFHLVLLVVSLFAAHQAHAKTLPYLFPTPTPVPSPTAAPTGPYAITSSEYHLPASIDSTVLAGVTTEVWGKIYRPSSRNGGPYPVVMFLHGNHSTCGYGANPIQSYSCDYTFSGTCPSGSFVIQNHLGYEYLANELASWGYVVVSINANRGITCGNAAPGDSGLNLARGRLILKHLSKLASWNRSVGTTPSSLGFDLHGWLDLNHVGLFGHSRAGEGVRAAYNLYRDSGSIWPAQIHDPIHFEGIFEVGPTDGQTSRVLNADGVAWNALLPMCDGDVVQLQGMKPYDRMLGATSEYKAAPKSTFAVWGANHNFYNTQWQISDSGGCVGMTPLWTGAVGSGDERTTALQSVIPFFRAHVGAGASIALANVFDPSQSLPNSLQAITRVDRAFNMSPNRQFVMRAEDFQGANGVGALDVDSSNVSVQFATVPEHDVALEAVKLAWSRAGSNVYFQDNWVSAGKGLDLLEAATVDFRVSRTASNLNGSAATNFTFQLVFDDQSLGPLVKLSQFANLLGPLGSLSVKTILHPTSTQDLHYTLQSVRVPVTELMGNSRKLVRGIRLVFNASTSGEIYLSDISLSRFADVTTAASFTHYGPGVYIPWTTNPGDLWNPVMNVGPATYTDITVAGKLITPTPTPVPNTNHVVSAAKIISNNVISEVRRAFDNAGSTKLTVYSSTQFEVRNALPMLRLNGKNVAAGSYSADLHSMSFVVPRDEINVLPNEFPMHIAHEEDPNGPVRDLGIVKRSVFGTYSN